MKFDREFLKWAWPDYDLVFPVDLMLSVAIIGVAATAALDGYSSIPFRAKLSEALYAAHNQKVELMERLALSGDPLELPLDTGAAASGVSVEDHLSGRRAASARRAEGKAEPQKVSDAVAASADARMGASRYVSSANVVGSAILVSGSIDGRKYDFGVFPAAADDEAPSVYLWFCGRSRVPEGMLAQPPAVRDSLPDAMLMRECRRRKGK